MVPAFKAVLYALLVANVGTFLAVDPEPHRAIDQLGWLLILGVFEYETRAARAGGGIATLRPLPLAIELFGHGCALYALWRYLVVPDWLEAANAVSWLMISAMIWVDILWPAPTGSGVTLRTVIKIPLYALTLLWAVIWGYRGSGLDFYDALLWILCFFIIEINILRIEGFGRPTASA